MTPQLAQRGLRPAAELAARKPCGTRIRYIGGCRCDACRKANSDYEGARQRARRAGDWNGIVPAANARAHMRALSRQGVGRGAVAAATDISRTVLQDIRAGRKLQIRARTERKILAVGPAQASDRALVRAASTWKLLDQLLEEGYARRLLLEKLGYKNGGFQFGRRRITVRNRARVERLHRELTT